MPSDEGSRIWTIIGKVSAVIALIIGVVTVYRFISPDEPSVLCKCKVATAKTGQIHADLRAALSEQRKTASYPTISKQLTDAQFKATEPGSTITEVSDRLAKSIWPESLTFLLIRLDTDRTIVDCTLNNAGSRQATDVTLRLPFEVAGAAIDDATAQVKLLPGNRVQLGIVKPNDTMRLYMWGNGDYPSEILSDQRFLLSYAEGVGHVQIARPTYGSVAAVAAFLSFLISHPIYSLFMLALVSFLLFALVMNLRHSAFQRGIRVATQAARTNSISRSPKLPPEVATVESTSPENGRGAG
jgi:hypothetical protein